LPIDYKMRWYIKDYKLDKLSARVESIGKNTISKQSYDSISLISANDGMYCIEQDRVHRLRHDSKFTHFFFNDVQLICQHSDPIKEEIKSHIPISYKCFNNSCIKYAIDYDPQILLCIEYLDGNICDFYFEPVAQTTLIAPLIELINASKKEINVFLSLLN